MEEHVKYNVNRLYNIYQKNNDKNSSFFDILKSIYPTATSKELNEMHELVIPYIDTEGNHRQKLSVIFKNLPNSPIRVNWRPSLADINSPNTIRKR